MSSYCDYLYEEYNETLTVAKSPVKCDACKEDIADGHRYYAIECVNHYAVPEHDDKDDVDEYNRCLRCQKLHEHLRTLGDGEMWPDEQLDCGEEYTEHWDKEPPPEIAELAFKGGADLQKELP